MKYLVFHRKNNKSAVSAPTTSSYAAEDEDWENESANWEAQVAS